MERQSITEEAVRWLDALKRDDADWDGFTRWLEASPDHRQAYDEMALLDQRLDDRREILSSIVPDEGAGDRGVRHWWAWGGGAGALAAAAIAGLVFLPVSPGQADQIYRTGRGEVREVALADGSHIVLAPASELVVKPGGERLALDGTATFAVPHRPDRTMTVEAAGLHIQDIGTRFEVATGEQSARVAVEEGRVSVAAAELAAPIRIESGKRLLVDRRLSRAELQPLREFASWRRGRLVYDNAPLALVAAEVGRYAGQNIALAPELSGRRFSGVLTIGDGSTLVADLARLMDIDARDQGAGVRLAARRAGS